MIHGGDTGLIAPGVPAGPRVRRPSPCAVTFDAVNDYLTRGGELTGVSDGKEGTISFWIRPAGSDGSTMRIVSSTNTRFTVARTAANQINITGRNTTPTTILENRSTSTITASSNWTHVMASWNLATPASSMWFNGVQETLTTDTKTDDNIEYTDTDISIGGHTSGTFKVDGQLAEFWFNTSFIDLTTLANRRKFFLADKRPAYLGRAGERPTGSSPLVYLRKFSGDAASTFATNRGTGGDFTVTGALADSPASWIIASF